MTYIIMSNSQQPLNIFAVILKEFIANPLAVISLLSVAGVCYLYSDIRNTFQSQIEVMREITVTLKEMNIRVEQLENWHRHEELQRQGVNKPNE